MYTWKDQGEIEIVTIDIKPVWKVGTKVTFSDMGDE